MVDKSLCYAKLTTFWLPHINQNLLHLKNWEEKNCKLRFYQSLHAGLFLGFVFFMMKYANRFMKLASFLTDRYCM